MRILILVESLGRYLELTEGFTIFLDRDRNVLFTYDASDAIIAYVPRSPSEVEEVERKRSVYRVRFAPFIHPSYARSLELSREEFENEKKRLLGKRVVDARMSETGIEIELEDGTTLSIYTLGEWTWIITKRNE